MRGIGCGPTGPASGLKALRVVLAVGFFLSVVLVFLDIHGAVSGRLVTWGLYFQFIPSLLTGIRAFSLAATGFLVVVLLTLLFGRIYCSSICPLGILMDVVAFMRKKFGGKPRHRYRPPHRAVRYAILVGTALVFASGSMLMLDLLDPFSLFGRMAVALAKPAVVVGNNTAAYVLESAGNYSVPPYQQKAVHVGMTAFTAAFTALLFWLAWTRGRLYCNLICPVGTLLGFFSMVSLVRVRIRQDACNSCRRCERVCKADCIDALSGIVNHSRYVACFNCLGACPTGAAVFSPVADGAPRTEKSQGHGTHTRRGFLAVVGASLALLPGASHGEKRIRVTVPNKIPVPRSSHPIVPPGGISLDHFTGTCTACHACIAHCPSQVLQPSLVEYGLAGLFMPRLDPAAGFCNFNCNQCGQVCPTGAITAFSPEEKRRLQVGVVNFIRDNCIVVLQKTDCGACSEHCPTKAVTMVTEGRVRVPRVVPEICLGCGACEHVCPAQPYKAIYVNPRTVHQIAKAPPPNRMKKGAISKGIGDFPF